MNIRTSISEKVYSDGSKARFMHFWNSDITGTMKITAKQFKELKKQGFPVKTTFTALLKNDL